MFTSQIFKVLERFCHTQSDYLLTETYSMVKFEKTEKLWKKVFILQFS